MKTKHTSIQVQTQGLPIRTDEQRSEQLTPRTRKWDAEIDIARQHDTWLQFEADIHQNPAAGQTGSVRARIARALDRYGLGTSDIAIDEALDFLIHKQLGQATRYFNQTGKAQFNPLLISHAVISYMAGKEQQRHITDCSLDQDDTDDERPATHLPDTSHITPDEYAARQDALRAIHSMIPEKDLELYDLWLAVRDEGKHGAPGTTPRLQRLAHRRGVALSTLYRHMTELAQTIQRHPCFDEITRPFRPLRRAA